MKSQATAKRKPAVKTKTSGKVVQFLHKPTCTTCRKARSYLEKRGYKLYFRDLTRNRLSPEELEKLIGRHDYQDFLNTRNEIYREKHLKDHPPSREEAVRMMAEEPNLIRRPVIVAGGRVVVGFDEKGMAKL